MRISPLLSAILLAAGGLITFVSDARPADDVADRAFKILKERCYDCHGVEFSIANLNVMDRTTLVADRNGKSRFIEPGDPDKSLIWVAINRSEADLQRMPADGALSDAEKETLREWIEAGAPFPEAKVDARPFVTDQDVLQQIRNHVFNVPKRDAEFMRYFTLTHLHNNLSVTNTDLRLYRAALSKAVNALSRKGTIVVPEKVDKWGTIYAVDLRKYGWEADNFKAWKQVVQAYPYGLKLLDRVPRNQFNQIQERIFDPVVSIRADWFVAKATRPPLYHALAGIPETLDELISKNKRQNDFKSNLLIRGGIQQSGVSTQNRLVDFFPAGPNTRETWISYDFQRSVARSNIFRFPLGPESLVDQKFQKFAFRHAGSEIIYRLPNGLHGYMLVDKDGKRIDIGPVSVVRDIHEISGSPEIVNGLSCMSCHKHGMIDIDDELTTGHALLAPDAVEKMDDLTGKNSPNRLNNRIKASRRAYLEALGTATAQFLQQGDDADKELTEFPEPISAVVRRFERDLDVNDVATELGIARDKDPQLKNDFRKFKDRLEDNNKLGLLGLRPLVNGGWIKRSAWETREDDRISALQAAAAEVLNATPIRDLKGSSEETAGDGN